MTSTADGLERLREPLTDGQIGTVLGRLDLPPRMSATASERVALLGFDAMGWESLSPFLETGKLPHLARLVREGAWGPLASVESYPSSAAAWTACMTGLMPDKSGVLTYEVQERQSYRRRVLQPGDRSGHPIWRLLRGRGHSLLVMGVPTFPAERVDGVMISGIFTETGIGAHPEVLSPALGALGLDIDPLLDILNLEGLSEGERFDLALEQLVRQGRVARHLFQRFGFDLAICVFVGTDRLLSRYFGDVEKRERICRAVDAIVGGFREALGDQGVLMVLSDHGLRPYHRNFNVFRWLHDEGYYNQTAAEQVRALEDAGLRRASRSPWQYAAWKLLRRLPRRESPLLRRLPIPAFIRIARGPQVEATAWGATRAFPFPSWRFPVGLIRLNLRGREPQGIVEPGREAEQLLEDLARRLLAVRDPGTGERLIEWVKRREELFSGPRAGDFPDLFYGMRPPYCANNRLHFRGPLLYDEAEPRFCHSYEGILLAAGRGVRPGMVAKARIADIAPTLLYLSGLPVDPYLDGRVLADLFRDEMLESRPPEVRDTGYGEEVQRQAQVVREADNQYIRKQLERMGYL